MTLHIGFAAGVTPTKWTRIWADRRPDVPLEVFRTEPGEQDAVLRDGRATVSLVRLPIDERDLSVIGLYNEIPVVVAAKDHDLGSAETVTVAELADEHLLQDPDDVPEWRDIAAEVRDGTRRALPDMKDLDDVMEQVAAGVGIAILPHSLARLHSRKDVISLPLQGVAETRIALAWLTAETSDDIEEFVGIVRGRTKGSSRADSPAAQTDDGKPVKKAKRTDKAKAAAKAVRAAAAQAKPAGARKTQNAPGRTRNSPNPRKRRS